MGNKTHFNNGDKMKSKKRMLDVYPIKIKIKNTDIKLFKDFRDLMMDELHLWESVDEKQKKLIWEMNNCLSDMWWFNQEYLDETEGVK